MKRILLVSGIIAVTTALAVAVYLVFQAARGPRHLSGPVAMVSDEARHRGYLGIGLELAPREQAARFGYPWAIFVTEVLPDSPAETAGFRVSDLIVQMDGKGPHSPEEFNKLGSTWKPNQVVQFHLYRQIDRSARWEQLRIDVRLISFEEHQRLLVRASEPTHFKAGQPDNYEEGSVVTRFQNRSVAIACRDGRLFALCTVCPHCSDPIRKVNWLEAMQTFKCPGCGSGFSMTGVRFEGPAARSLERLAIKVAQHGELEIDPRRKFQKELGQWDDPAASVVKSRPQAQINNPPEGGAHKQAVQNKDVQELEKRVREDFLAECKENDRLYKQMVKGNPKDTRAWLLLGWNAAYNLSVTSDDVKERYAHVKQGVEHLVEGLTHNPTNAALCWDVGFYLHNRIGQSYARKPFRALFRNDKEFHKLLAGHVDLKAVAGPDGLPANHLVARRWFEKTIATVEKHAMPAEFPKDRTAVVLHAYPAICQRAHARAIEDDGHFGEAAANAWKQALKMLEALGEREFVAEGGTKYRLKDNETARKTMNYDYWKKRCEVEQTARVLAARQAVYRADEHLSRFKFLGRWPWEENLPSRREDFTDKARNEAKQLYDQAFHAWAEVYKEHAWLVENEDELDNVIWQYQRRVLNGKPLPDDFPLRQFPSLLPRTP
jgi:nitrite reductase/ring-hydroxylating ferredoxin subunit